MKINQQHHKHIDEDKRGIQLLIYGKARIIMVIMIYHSGLGLMVIID